MDDSTLIGMKALRNFGNDEGSVAPVAENDMDLMTIICRPPRGLSDHESRFSPGLRLGLKI